MIERWYLHCCRIAIEDDGIYNRAIDCIDYLRKKISNPPPKAVRIIGRDRYVWVISEADLGDGVEVDWQGAEGFMGALFDVGQMRKIAWLGYPPIHKRGKSKSLIPYQTGDEKKEYLTKCFAEMPAKLNEQGIEFTYENAQTYMEHALGTYLYEHRNDVASFIMTDDIECMEYKTMGVEEWQTYEWEETLSMPQETMAPSSTSTPMEQSTGTPEKAEYLKV